MARITESLVAQLNAARGLKYSDVGYTYWADVTGSGVSSPRLWRVINPQGAVTYSTLNAPSARQRCAKLRQAIKESSK